MFCGGVIMDVSLDLAVENDGAFPAALYRGVSPKVLPKGRTYVANDGLNRFAEKALFSCFTINISSSRGCKS